MNLRTIRFASLLFLVALLGISLLGGCGRPAQTNNAGGAKSTMVTIKGSDTMVQLVSNWAEAYMKANPDTQVSVTGGGSGTGIAALLNGTTDIAAASRSMEPKERELAEQKKMNLQEVPVGLDGIAVIVNPANPVQNLTMDQLKQIYTGKITNWNQAGGPDEPILVYSRESSSGTYVFFQEHVLKKEDYAKSVRLMPSNAAIVQAVSNDSTGIGYVGLGYASKAANKIKMVPVKADEQAEAILPSEDTVRSGDYAISRALYFYLMDNAPEAVNNFVSFRQTPEGKTILEEAG